MKWYSVLYIQIITLEPGLKQFGQWSWLIDEITETHNCSWCSVGTMKNVVHNIFIFCIQSPHLWVTAILRTLQFTTSESNKHGDGADKHRNINKENLGFKPTIIGFWQDSEGHIHLWNDWIGTVLHNMSLHIAHTNLITMKNMKQGRKRLKMGKDDLQNGCSGSHL